MKHTKKTPRCKILDVHIRTAEKDCSGPKNGSPVFGAVSLKESNKPKLKK